jgi:hypothetical protein
MCNFYKLFVNLFLYSGTDGKLCPRIVIELIKLNNE